MTDVEEPRSDYQLDYVFKQKSIHGLGAPADGAGWNDYFRSTGLLPGWDELRDKTFNEPMYKSYDFDNLFKPEDEVL